MFGGTLNLALYIYLSYWKTNQLTSLLRTVQVFAIPGGAQAKVEDMSRALLSHVSQIPGKSFFQQVTSGSNQPLADFGKKLAVSVYATARDISTSDELRWVIIQ